MLRTIDYAQLDPDTKAYLRRVREADGRGTPGVFEATATARPLAALLAGLVVLPLFVWVGYGTNKAPWAAALLQTAGVVLGGWLVLYAVRRWGAGKDRFAGQFVYFDPEHVFVGRGEELLYARLDPDAEVTPGGADRVTVKTDDGTFAVPVPNRRLALFAADYYDALAHLRDTAGWWSDEDPATLGAMARYMVVNERVPTNLSEVTLDVDRLPAEVRPARRRPSGALRYLAVLAAFAGVYALFYLSDAPAHDAGAWAGVNKTSPADLRHYLADPHTAAHHAEATAELGKLYDAKLTEVRSKGTDPEVREALARLLDTLRGGRDAGGEHRRFRGRPGGAGRLAGQAPRAAGRRPGHGGGAGVHRVREEAGRQAGAVGGELRRRRRADRVDAHRPHLAGRRAVRHRPPHLRAARPQHGGGGVRRPDAPGGGPSAEGGRTAEGGRRTGKVPGSKFQVPSLLDL